MDHVTRNAKKRLESLDIASINIYYLSSKIQKKGKRKVQGVPQSQTAALPRPQEEEETDKLKVTGTDQITRMQADRRLFYSDIAKIYFHMTARLSKHFYLLTRFCQRR